MDFYHSDWFSESRLAVVILMFDRIWKMRAASVAAVNSRFGKLSTEKIQKIIGKDPQTKESHN